MSDHLLRTAAGATLQQGQYATGLALLSFGIAVFAAWVALQMTAHGRVQANVSRRLHLIGSLAGSVALGCGIWASHFIGLLALQLHTSVRYQPGLSALSLLPALLAAWVILSVIGRRKIGAARLLGSALLLGMAASAMHHLGLYAMQLPLSLHYLPRLLALSLLAAVLLAALALWIRFGLRHWRRMLSPALRQLLSALVMGGAITGMHVSGMLGVRFAGVIPPGIGVGLDRSMLATCLTLLTLALTVLIASGVGLLRYRELFRHLVQSENWMRSLLSTTVDAIVTIDKAGAIVDFNGAAERIFGWRHDEIIGSNVSILMSAERQAEQQGLLTYLRTGAGNVLNRSEETLCVRKDGSTVPIRRSMAHARLADQDLYVLFITDISERRAMLTALRESEQQLRSLVGNLPGIAFRCTTDPEQPMLFVSDGVEAVTGYPAAAFLGNPPQLSISGLIVDEDRDQAQQIFEAGIASGQPYLLEYRLRHADGKLRWLWERGTVVHDSQGAVRWVDGVILDISERRRMEEDLRMAKEKAELAAAARTSFVANISHEIRTPMNAILGFTDVLLDSPLTAEQRRHLDTVRQSGRSLLRLLNDVLDTAKLEKGAMALELRDYSLRRLIDELAASYGGNAHAKGLQLLVQFDAQVPALLHGDELRMRQVLGNLLDNAIKFTASGTVVLSARLEQGQLHLAVRDSGIGIAAERREAIFEAFVQADASTTRRFGGSGLGTTISKQLVKLMDGRIWADAALPHGSVFHVVLPLQPARMLPQALPERRSVPLPPLSMLAADDVPQNLELLSLLLRKHGHSVQTAADGEQVLLMAQQQKFDLILLDLQMPRMDGLAASAALRAAALRDGRPRVPLIAMTASVLDTHRQAALAAGMDGFAVKPVEWQALSHEIARVLQLSHTRTGAPAALTAPAGAAPLPVLDFARGVQRWGGSDGAYRAALAQFARSHAGLPAPLQQALAGGEPAAALAHQLRGVCANLGLQQLAASLAVLEQAGHGAAPDRLALLQEQWQAAMAAIAALTPVGAMPLGEGAIDAAGAQQAASMLLQSLRRGELHDSAQASLQAAMGQQADALAPLHEAIDDFDFPLAQALLQALLSRLELELP